MMSRPRRPLIANRRVLIVDDYVDSADAVALCLDLLGFATHTAYGGFAALEIAATWQPSYVILDIMMPDMSGFAVATRLRADPLTADSILLAYTAANTPSDYSQAKSAGFDALCEKPADPSHLATLLQRLSDPHKSNS